MTDKYDAFLDEIFAAARESNDTMSDALLDRVVADAGLVPRPPVRETLWQSFVASVGGWPAMGGVLTAGLAGIWVGFMPPTQVDTVAANLLGTTTSVSFLGEFDDLIEAELSDG